MTKLVARSIQAPADALMLARRLEAAGLEHVALLLGRERAWIAAAPDTESAALDPIDEVVDGPSELTRAPRWIGIIPYESRRGLERPAWRVAEQRAAPLCCEPSWLRYPAVLSVMHGEVMAIGEPAAVARLGRAATRATDGGSDARLRVSSDEPDAAHLTRVSRARELILAGDVYQVNLARRLDVTLEHGTPIDAFARMVRRAPSGYAAMLSLPRERHVLSTSPELLLHASPGRDGAWGRLATEPIKGTRPRGHDAPSDAALVRELDVDPKERAELAMIIDVERNDLSRVCRVGSVRIAQGPSVSTCGTVHHRKALLVGHARADATRREVLEAMVPSGSVTGAPKVRAMEVIATLESERRGLYTGAIGYASHDGGMVLSMAIRTAVLAGARGVYWTGGGIVVDSDPERELRETAWKALQLG